MSNIDDTGGGAKGGSLRDLPTAMLEEAAEHLKWFRPDGPWVLTAIPPEGGATDTETFGPMSEADMMKWLEKHSGKMNLYFMVNPARRPLNSKAKKEDVEELGWLHVDSDPKKGEDPAEARQRALVALKAFTPPPSLIIDSGGGLQGFWRLDEPVFIGGNIASAEEVEAYNRQIEIMLDGDSCHNVDRIMRLPGTINLPNAKKRKEGRVPRLASVLEKSDNEYSLAEFTAAPRVQNESEGSATARVKISGNLPPVSLDDLPEEVSPRTRMLIVQGDDPDDQLRYASRSEALFAVCCDLVRAGCNDDTIAAVILDPDHGISRSVLDKRGGAIRYAERQIERAREFAHEVDKNGRRVLSLAAPFRSAQRLRAEVYPHTIHINGDWLKYSNGAYVLVEDKTMRSELYHILNDAVVVARVEDDKPVFQPFNPDPTKVRKVTEGLEAVCHEEADAKAPPAWLGEEGPPPLEIISLRNGLLHLRTGELLPPTPEFFTRNALEIEYDPNAPEPEHWLKFLESLWPEGPEPDVLQEMFGYLLLPDTSMQKIFLLVGPPRSGKGTVLKVLTSLIGRPNVAAPSIGELGKDFGLEALIGKQLAAITDMRFGKNADLGEIATNLLRISGEDEVSANRKGKSYWTGRLAVRFLILANGLPKFEENSPALANRFVPLIFNKSFLGKEDRGLIHRLLLELPSILNWAIDGWRRLQERGNFLLPSASREAVDAIQEHSSAIAAFLAEMTDIGPGHNVPKDEMFAAWLRWCERNGEKPGGKTKLTQLLKEAAGIGTGKPGTDDRVPSYIGVQLKLSGKPREDAQGNWRESRGRVYDN